MNIVHIVNPVEYSLVRWLNGHPESGHPLDMRQFYRFVKTICRFKATRWKDIEQVRKQILALRPTFGQKCLDHLMEIFPHLVDSYSCVPYEGGLSYEDREVSDNHYLEIRVNNGRFITKEIPLSEYGGRKLKTSKRIT